MGITLDELIFDPSNPDDGANVGAHVRAGDDGTAIGHVGDALKVDIGSVADLDIRDLDASQDNVAISDGTDTLGVNADGSINVNFASGAQIEITDGTDTLAINADGSINSVVTATDLDIRDLSFATDSVDVTGSEVKNDAYNTFKATAQTVTSTASQLAATSLTDRSRITVQNLGVKEIYVGEANTVTTSTGVRIARGASAEFDASATATLWAITPSGTADVRLMERAY